MRQIVGDKPAQELLAELTLLNEVQPDELRPGEYTVGQLAEMSGQSRATVERTLRIRIRQGRIEARSVIVRTNGHNRRAMVYRVSNPCASA